MKKKTLSIIAPVFAALILSLYVFAAISAFSNLTIMYIELSVAIILTAVAVICILWIRKNMQKFFATAARNVEGSGTRTLADFVVPIMVTNQLGEITWYNENFRSSLLRGNDVFAEPQSMFFTEDDVRRLNENGRTRIDYNDRKYIVFQYKFDEDKNNQHMFFFIDDTGNFKIAQSYRDSRPCMMFIHVDGLDLLLKNALESQKTEIKGEIEKQIELITAVSAGYLQKISSTRYLLITDNRGYEKMKADKFSVLSKVRTLDFGERGGASLSIGVGLGASSISESIEYANNALDMALGRGGDQAVIKNKDEFSFFGGIAQTAQVNNRVRTRVIAATLKKLIENSENVLLMGHGYSDMDCFGAAYALCCAVQSMGKSAKIVIDEKKSLAKPLIESVKQADRQLDFIERPETALLHIGHKTLLIIVDTHRPSFLENKAVYEKSPTVVVIDHHRQTVDFIDNSLLFYHDPSSSSTCEMVTELLQYMGSNLIGKTQAEALLAGISLDTRNFVMKTSSRTFEASGYLRSRGADPVNVRKLFADSLDTYTSRASIVANSTLYSSYYAISSCPESCKNCRIASSEAADELLTIQGVEASFVMYKDGDKVNISARSFGGVNVQLIMEDLGGGGHQTMAAAQIECKTTEDASKKLIMAIDRYNNNKI